MKILLGILVIICYTSCENMVVDSSLQKFEISDEALQNHWEKGNSNYIRYYIDYLRDSTLSDCEFEDRIGELEIRTQFIFANIACGDSTWLKMTKEKRVIYRKIILLALTEYSNSCLFMKKKNWFICGQEDLKKYVKPNLLDNPLLLDSFRNDIKKICYDCSFMGKISNQLSR